MINFPSSRKTIILKPGDLLEDETYVDALERRQREEQQIEFECLNIRRRHAKQKGAEIFFEKEFEPGF